MTDADETTLKRLRLRSWRRGMKEMDLILGAYADHRLAELSRDDVALYERMLFENDQELYTWVNGQTPPQAEFEALIDDIVRFMERHVQKTRAS